MILYWIIPGEERKNKKPLGLTEEQSLEMQINLATLYNIWEMLELSARFSSSLAAEIHGNCGNSPWDSSLSFTLGGELN